MATEILMPKLVFARHGLNVNPRGAWMPIQGLPGSVFQAGGLGVLPTRASGIEETNGWPDRGG